MFRRLANRFDTRMNMSIDSAETCRLLNSIGAGDREILALRYVDGLRNAEIAAILSLNPDAVSKRHGRAIRRLHEAMRDDEKVSDGDDAAR